ncbi:MAG: hypothetical protein AUJ97_02200 [Bacteroidetes bacterium CG2_30_32_10]|nr:MAG: hypothetical protein AUJ97_02200 [Bacteroidetes bacterium CG2_30_32_10]
MKHKIKSDSYSPINDKEAWIGILYACISSDGEIGKSEIESLSRMIANKSKFNGIEIPPLCKKITEAIKSIGSKGLVDACCPLIKAEDKPTLFSMAVEIVLSDGLLEMEEQKIIEYLAKTLAMDKVLVIKIIEVMLIRNKGNLILD